MKKFMQIVTATIISVGFMGSVAGAETCGDTTIDQSGNDSSVNVTCNNYNNVTLTCVDNTFVATFNEQGSHSGNATVDGNGSLGDAATGTAQNSAGNDVQIGAKGCDTAGETTPAPTATPLTPGKGDFSPAAASLPNTAANNAATVIAVSLVSAAAVVGLSRAGVAAYRRIGNK